MNFTIQFKLNMAKKIRRTKNQKLKTVERKQGFQIKSEWLKTSEVNKNISKEIKVDNKQFRADLTKTFVLTMLVLALELALWNYLSRR